MRRVLAVAAVMVVAGCSAKSDLPVAQARIADFHQKLNAGQFDTIYADASANLKAGSTAAAMTQLLSAVHRKLGAFQSGVVDGWNETASTNGRFITIAYKATYAGGAADENFVYRVGDGQAALAGYHINSMALIVN